MATSCVVVWSLLLSLALTASAGVVQFSLNPASQEVGWGRPVSLECAVDGDTAVTQWLREGAPVIPDSNLVVSGGRLDISAFDESQSGEYRCVAGDPPQVSHPGVLSHFSQRSFTVHPEDFPVYLVPEEAILQNPREAAAFQCQFEYLRYGALPRIHWQKEVNGNISDVEFAGSLRYVPFQYDHTAYLQLHFPVDSDNGTRVRCVASNHDNSSETNVTSNWAQVILSDQMRPADFIVFSTEPPSQVHFIDGQDLVLGCSKTTPNTSLSLGWYRNGRQFFSQGIPTQFGFVGEVEVYGFTNIRLNPAINHEGFTYTCRFNDEGVQRSRDSEVVPPPLIPDLEYRYVVKQADIPFGIPALTLNFNGTSGVVRWWFRAALLANGPKHTIDPSDGYSLTIRDLVFSHAGVYQAEEIGRTPSTLIIFEIRITANECDLGLHNCHPNALCEDADVGFVCTCETGFEGNGTVCQDVDECASEAIACPLDKICVNTVGGHICTSADVNECQLGTHSCSLDADCTNTEGSYICTCRTGYFGNGIVCQPVTGNDTCDLEPVTGPCLAYFPSYFYNSTTGNCEMFVYGGCQGNDNRFETVSDCLEACGGNQDTDGNDTCNLEPVTGPCEADIPSYFYNSTAGNCEMFVYGGCQGNDNRFETVIDCLEACGGIQVTDASSGDDDDLEGWEIALIVLFILLLLLLCCCCWWLLCLLCWRRRRGREYFAEKNEKHYRKEFQQYRKTADDDDDDEDV